MNDESNNSADDATAGPVAGERLAEARRLRQISLPDIARELHIDEVKVQALEENKFDVLGAPVFAKGHLRKYAGIVGVPIDDVMADYYALTRLAGAPPIVGPPRNRHRELSLGPWLLLIPVVLFAAAIYWWLTRPTSPEPVVAPPRPAVSEPAADAQQAISRVTNSNNAALAEPREPGSEPEPDSASISGDAATKAAATEVAASVVPRTAPAANAELTLRLVFSGDCWTEVTSGDGRRLFFNLGQAGRTLSLSGTAPIRVLLGNADNATLSVNGEPYRIAASDRRGDTARLSINR